MLNLLFLADAATPEAAATRAASGAIWRATDWGPYDPAAVEALQALVATGKARVAEKGPASGSAEGPSCRDADVIAPTEALLQAPELGMDPATRATLRHTVDRYGALPAERLQALVAERAADYFRPERIAARRAAQTLPPAQSVLAAEVAAAFPRTALVRDTVSTITGGLRVWDHFDHAARAAQDGAAEPTEHASR